MDRLETAQLATFVVLAEELHFGRAAERLGTSQPALSRSFGRLERRLGVRLLERTSRRVALTDAGVVLLREARAALAAVDRATELVRAAGRETRIVLALRPGVGSGLLPEVLQAYAGRPGAVAVDVELTSAHLDAVRAGRADATLVCGSNDLSGLHTADLLTEPRVVLVPAGHPLARRTEVTASELRRRPEFEPSCPVLSLDQVVEHVALGQGIVVVGATVVDRIGSAVAAVPVPDLPPNLLTLAWTDRPDPAAMAEFAAAAREVSRRWPAA